MSGVDEPDDGDIEQTHSQLSEGLKSCRAVMNSYRALLSADPVAGAGDGVTAAPTDDEAQPASGALP